MDRTSALHVSLDVRELAPALAFYRALLGEEPSVSEPDYARFTPADPPLVLALNLVDGAASGRGPLQHLGLAFAAPEDLERARMRLSAAGIAHEEQPDVVCCYARLTRAWVRSPEGVRWELFVTHEAYVPASSRAARAACCP